MGEGVDRGAAWVAAQRVEEWAGEIRVNLIRLIAISVFYGHHLINYYLLGLNLPSHYHLSVSAIALAWVSGGMALHVGLSRRWNPPWLKYAAIAFDALMVTAVLVLSDGPKSPLRLLLFLTIATAPLRLHLRVVWAATLSAILSYAFTCGHAAWFMEAWRVPRHQQIIVVLALACAGLLAGQAVRQGRRLARDYADRIKPEDPA